MAFDPVPWAITGSQLDTFVMRELANFATRGSEGIQLPGDLKVTASGTNVSIDTGGVCILNRQAAGQSYIGRVASPTLVPIPANGTGATVSHLIVATIRDNDFSPWQPWPGGTPQNTILYGPYFYPERLSASLSTTKASQLVSYSAYALARVDMPAGTSTVLAGYITDLRNLAQPRIGFAQAVQSGPATEDFLALSETTYRTWPNTNTLGVTVPTWATHCVGQISLNSVMTTGNAYADTRINLGGLFGTAVPYDHNAPPSGVNGDIYNGVPHTVFADIDVRSLQGQTVTCSVQARRAFTATATAPMSVNSKQQVAFDLRFVERTV
jgi:hypothetical protein